MPMISTRARALFAASAVAVSLFTQPPAVAVAQTIPTSGLPLVDPGPALTSDEQQFYGKRSPIELCYNPDVTIRDLQAVQLLKLDCDRFKKKNGFLSFGIYGYNHPAPTYCNSGNSARTGLLGFLTGNSVGNKNLITSIGTFLAILFAGCNNVPVTASTGSTPPANTQTPPVAPATPIVLSQSTLSAAAGQPATLLVSEPGAVGPFTATSDNAAFVVTSDAGGKASETGGQVKFTITPTIGTPSGTKATITVADSNKNQTTLSVKIP